MIEIPMTVAPTIESKEMTLSAEYHTYPEYTGPFEVIPNERFQILRVSGKIVDRDIIIYPATVRR